MACGSGSSSAPEMAPLPSGPGEPEPADPARERIARLTQLMDELARGLEAAGEDCDRVETSVKQFAVRHGDELRRLTEEIDSAGQETEAQQAATTAAQQAVRRVGRACPQADLAPLFERQEATSPAEAFAMNARSGSTVYWRVGAECHVWKMAGEQSGELLRMSPAPVMRFSFEVAAGQVVLFGSTDQSGPLSEVGVEASCRDTLSLGGDDSVGFSLGDGLWYWNEKECLADAARAAPGGCASALSASFVERAFEHDLLAAVIKKNGRVSVVSRLDARVDCASWRFAGKARKKRMERRDGDAVTYYEASYAGNKLTLSGPNFESPGAVGGIGSFETYPVRQISRNVYRVGEFPWFIGDACDGLKMATE